MSSRIKTNKVAIVGTGMVGATIAYTLTIKGLAQELCLINKPLERAEGEAMELNHCLPFVPPMDIKAGGYELCADAQVVIIAAGLPQKEGESRLELCERNAVVTREIVRSIMEYNSNPILLLVTNPVDILTHVALDESGLPPERVIGSGTVLDTARFRYLVSDYCKVDARNVHGYVIGEHGDSEVLVWSRLNVAGVPFATYCDKFITNSSPRCNQDKIDNEVRNAAYEIIKRKKATFYAVSVAAARILEAILKDQGSYMSVSTLMQGQYGLEGVCLSLPSLVGSNGVSTILDSPLSPSEEEALLKSADTLRNTVKGIGL